MSVKFTVIRPKTINPAVFDKAFLAAAEKMAQEVHKDFDDVTKRWKNIPEFEETAAKTSSGFEVKVLTDDRVFKYYDQGNGGPNFIIRPKNSRVLHWVDPSGEDVFVAYVHGYEGRQAVAKIEQMWREKAPLFFVDAMSEAAKDSGHSI